MDIVATSLRNNARDGITGFLHSEQDHFLQYLEGPHDAVMTKLAKIQKDPRHYNFMILADGTTDERLYPGWDMGQLEALHPDDTALLHAMSAWLKPDPDIDPLPILSAFAASALGANASEITAVS